MPRRRSSSRDPDGRSRLSIASWPSIFGASFRRRTGALPFRRGQAGAASIEAVISIGVFVIGFAGLMEVVGTTYDSDRWERGAQAAARAIALNRHDPDPKGKACEAIRDELQLDSSFDCLTEWPDFTVDKDVRPDELPDALLETDGTIKSVKGNTGDMVLVRIPTGSTVAMGLARAEP